MPELTPVFEHAAARYQDVVDRGKGEYYEDAAYKVIFSYAEQMKALGLFGPARVQGELVWHGERSLAGYDAIVLPGDINCASARIFM